jgi:hypothetical protein
MPILLNEGANTMKQPTPAKPKTPRTPEEKAAEKRMKDAFVRHGGGPELHKIIDEEHAKLAALKKPREP